MEALQSESAKAAPEPTKPLDKPNLRYFHCSSGWCSSGETEWNDSKEQTIKATLVGSDPSMNVFVARNSVIEKIDLQFSTFFKQTAVPLKFSLEIAASCPLTELIKQACQHMTEELKLPVEEECVRLVNMSNGSEITQPLKKRKSSPPDSRCVAQLGLRPPFRILVIVDDAARFTFDRSGQPDCIKFDRSDWHCDSAD